MEKEATPGNHGVIIQKEMVRRAVQVCFGPSVGSMTTHVHNLIISLYQQKPEKRHGH
jgi:hypothetical protein